MRLYLEGEGEEQTKRPTATPSDTEMRTLKDWRGISPSRSRSNASSTQLVVISTLAVAWPTDE